MGELNKDMGNYNCYQLKHIVFIYYRNLSEDQIRKPLTLRDLYTCHTASYLKSGQPHKLYVASVMTHL